MPISRSLRAGRKKPKQTRLQFAQLSSSSPAKEQYSTAVQERLANLRYSGSRRGRPSSPSEPEPAHDGLPTPEPSSQPQHHSANTIAAASPQLSLRSHTADLDSDEASGSKPTTSDDEDEIALPSSKRRRTRAITYSQETENETPTRKSRRLARQTSPLQRKRISPTPSKEDLSDLGEPETSGDEDDVMATQPISGRRQPKKVDDPFVVDDDRIEYISSDEEAAPKSRRSKKSAGNEWLVDDDEVEYISSEVAAVTPSKTSKKSKKQKSARLQRKISRQEQEELEEDLEDLKDSDGETKKSRTRVGPLNTQRDKAREHFALLKRRRAGEIAPRIADSDEDEPVDIDQIALDNNTYKISDNDSVHSSVDTELDNEEPPPEDDFIVQDTTSSHRLGLPHPDIPLEFTSYATSKPRDLFIHIIEWLVKNRIAPAFSRHDPIYRLAFSKVSDQVTAQAGSRLISSAWNADFKNTILARPHIRVSYIDDGDDADNIRTCDACNKTNHPARYDFVLEGTPYRKNDLEPVEDDDEEEDVEGSVDEAGHALPLSNTHFYLGRFCAANAEMGHKLTHWLYHLNGSLMTYLEEQEVLSPEAIVAREGLKKKKKEREAEAIVDSMEATGVVAELWRSFQDDLDDARLGMEDFEKRGRRGQQRIGSIRATGSDGVMREWKDQNRVKVFARADESDDSD